MGRLADLYGPGFPTTQSHEAADCAVALASDGEVDAIMKGSLATEELMAAISAPENGLRTDRQLSHVFALDAPGYPRPIFLTDAGDTEGTLLASLALATFVAHAKKRLGTVTKPVPAVPSP